MKHHTNASYCQLLILLTYIVPMLDELVGDQFVLGAIEASTDGRGNATHAIDVELLGLGWSFRLRVETGNANRYFVAFGDLLPGEGVSEFAPQLDATSGMLLSEQARSFTLALQAALKAGMRAALEETRSQVEVLAKLDLS